MIRQRIAQVYGGVYMLLDKGEIVYVGESSNIPARIEQHILSDKQFDDFKAYKCDNRKEMETYLIKLLSPKYNIQERPKGRPFSIFDQSKAINDEIDALIAIKKKAITTVSIPFDSVKLLFGLDFKGHIAEIRQLLKKYSAYIGEKDGESWYNLSIITYYYPEIGAEIIRIIFGHKSSFRYGD